MNTTSAPKTTAARKHKPLTSCWPLKRKVLSIRPCSLANAINEPVNDTEPISAPTTARIVCVVVNECSKCVCIPAASNALAPIAAAEPPPMPLYSATICGMSVIATFLPLYQASAVESAVAMKISAAFSIST